ncbi:MAG: DUF6754 domain-containing protein [Candidatus Cloacimonadia bacterium]
MLKHRNCYLILFLIAIILPISSLYATKAKNIITDLEINDVPHDNGDGLTLTWTPLPAENRIIEYRVYRGASPDTLFHIGTIEIDPMVGVASPKLFYTDSGFGEFVDFFSPAKLRREVQQKENSPLFRKMPRDQKVFGKYLNDFTVLAMIPKKNYYFQSKAIDASEISEDDETSRDIMGGLPFRKFDGFLASIIPNKPYYYTVLAVDEKRHYYDYAPIVEGIPLPNSPEKPYSFSVATIQDENRLQFEWTDPSISNQVLQRNVHIITEDKMAVMERYIEAIDKKNIEEAETNLKDPSTIIYTTNATFPNLHYIEYSEGKFEDCHNSINYNFDWKTPEKYRFILSYDDYLGNRTFSEIVAPAVTNSTEIPSMPSYQFSDKPDDKGDYNQLLYGRPLVFMTQATFLNGKRTKIMLNYDFVDNPKDKIKGITFKFYDQQGRLIKEIDEFLPEKMVKLKIDDSSIMREGLSVEMTPKLISESGFKSYTLTQTVHYNDEFGLFENSELMLEDEVVSDYSYYVYRRSRLDSDFDLARLLSPFTRSYDDNIPYEETIYRVVNQIDPKTGYILFDSSITIEYDRDKDQYATTSIFGSEIKKDIAFYKEKIARLETESSSASEEELPSIQGELEYYREKLWLETEHPLLSKINQISDPKQRLKELLEINERNSRSYEYIFAKTDNNALFRVDPVYKVDGDSYLYPISNWFKRDQIPALIASLLFGLIVFLVIRQALKGKEMYIRPIAGLQEIDNAVGRATEMGRPILYVPGFGYIEETATLASLSILSNVARKTAEYDTRVLVPVADYIVLPVAMETVRESHISAGRPDTYNRDDIFYIAGDQFAFVAAVNGIMIREKTAANFYLGVFFAEALIMTEVGNTQGAIQIAGSDSTTQIPFFITTCDYTLIGEELYGASAYLSKDPMILGTLKAQDYAKVIMIAFIVLGSILSTFKITFLIRAFPSQ